MLRTGPGVGTRHADLDGMRVRSVVDPILAQFLAALVRARLNVVIAGPAGSDRTGLMRAMATAADANPPVLVGEIRSGGVIAAGGMGTRRGCLGTLLARHVDTVVYRLAGLLLRHRRMPTLPAAWLSLVTAVDYIVYLDTPTGLTPTGGHRAGCVSHVLEITGLGPGQVPATGVVFGPDPHGRAVPHTLPQRSCTPLRRAGFNLRLLAHRQGAWPLPAPPEHGR